MAIKRIVLFLTVVFFVQSCLFVKAPDNKVVVQDAPLSPQAELPMSEELVRTRQGDMIALLPQGWVFIDTKQSTSPDIVAVAVNPEYTLSVVFSNLTSAQTTQEELQREGMLGLARVAFNKHNKKSGGVAKLIGTYELANLGPRKFGLYDFTVNSSARTRCAVFTSSIGEHYEVAVVPMNVTGRDIPADSLQRKVFRSILSTVQF